MWFLVSSYTGARIYNGILNAGGSVSLAFSEGFLPGMARTHPQKTEYINAVSVPNEIYTERKGGLLCVALAGLSHPGKWWRQSCLCEKRLLEI